MFEIADEAYAVENAIDELKEKATSVIDGNDEDGVAKFLSERWDGDKFVTEIEGETRKVQNKSTDRQSYNETV